MAYTRAQLQEIEKSLQDFRVDKNLTGDNMKCIKATCTSLNNIVALMSSMASSKSVPFEFSDCPEGLLSEWAIWRLGKECKPKPQVQSDKTLARFSAPTHTPSAAPALSRVAAVSPSTPQVQENRSVTKRQRVEELATFPSKRPKAIEGAPKLVRYHMGLLKERALENPELEEPMEFLGYSVDAFLLGGKPDLFHFHMDSVRKMAPRTDGMNKAIGLLFCAIDYFEKVRARSM